MIFAYLRDIERLLLIIVLIGRRILNFTVFGCFNILILQILSHAVLMLFKDL